MTDKPKRYSNLAEDPTPAVKAKMREFADLYRGGPDDVRGNAVKCYMALHPKAKMTTAKPKSVDYWKHPYVQAYLKEKTDAVADEADVNQRKVVKELVRVGMYDFRKLFDDAGKPLAPHELDEDIAAAVVGLKVTTVMGSEEDPALTRYEYKLPEKTPALDKLMKHLGGYEKDNSQKAKSLQELIDEVRGEK